MVPLNEDRGPFPRRGGGHAGNGRSRSYQKVLQSYACSGRRVPQCPGANGAAGITLGRLSPGPAPVLVVLRDVTLGRFCWPVHMMLGSWQAETGRYKSVADRWPRWKAASRAGTM